MASSATEDILNSLFQLIQIVFSPLFPVILLTTCLAAFLLTFVFHLPQFVLFAYLANSAFDYALGHLWALAALAVFVLAALPLALVGFREHAAKTSSVLGGWIVVALMGGGTIWLANEWAFDDQSSLQQFVFAWLLFCACVGFCQTLTGTLKLIALSRPQPGREVVEAQKAHGDARVAGEAEALSLLNSKR
jgi:hypothetical protein